MADKYTAADVFDALHIPYPDKKNVQVICPRCGKKTFYMEMERSVGHCYRASCEFRGNQISYYAETMGIDNKEANRQMLAYKGYDSTSEKKEVKPAKKMHFEESEMACIDKRNEVYSKFKEILPLSKRHISDMEKRGLTEAEIAQLGYCSYDVTSYNGESIANKIGIPVKGIPGFFIDNNEKWALRSLKKGIAIPFKDRHDRIQGFQLRKNDELLRVFDNGDKEKKCNWVSSTGLKEGCSTKSFVHYACDFCYDFMAGTTLPIFKSNVIRLTEGGMKADIIHIVTGDSVIGIAGVNSLAQLEKELPFLKSQGIDTILDTFDMDYITNKNVACAMEKLKLMIIKAEMHYVRRNWETEVPYHKPLKGYDDYVVYHMRGV